MPGAVPEHVAKTEPNTGAVTHRTEGMVIIGELHRAQGAAVFWEADGHGRGSHDRSRTTSPGRGQSK